MPYDGLTVYKVCREIKEAISSCKVYKIYQPLKDEIIIYFSDRNKTAVRFSANASFARVNITNTSYANSEYPPPFCMLLRKYLLGAILKDVRQLNNDRIIAFDFEGLTGAGSLVKTSLITEIMGKHSNIILTDSDGAILDAIKHVSFLKSSIREVLPKKEYILPPNGKLPAFDFFAEEAASQMRYISQKSLKSALVATISGISNQLAQSFIAEEKIAADKTPGDYSEDELTDLLNHFKKYAANTLNSQSAYIYSDADGVLKDFSCGYYSCYDNLNAKEYLSVNLAADTFYSKRAVNNFICSNYDNVIKELEHKLSREENKLRLRREERERADGADIFNVYGNLLLSNIHMVKKGSSSVEVTDYYNNNASATIPLRADLSPSQNAQAYFKKYAKAKNALKHLDGLINECEELIYYLSSQLYYLNSAEKAEDADAVVEELKKHDIIKDKKKKNKTPRPDLKPLYFETSDGYTVRVGKNDKQNDALTFKRAEKDDIWLHAKDIPGSHVILKTENGKYSENSLYEAALLAAHHSKARGSEKTAVDYTQVGNVKKIHGSSYGKVTYTDNKTLYVTPNELNIGKIKLLKDEKS